MTKYVINKNQSVIGLTGLNKEIPIGGWIEVTNEDAKHSDVLEAERRGWIKISLTKPADAVPFKPNLEFQTPAVRGSSTIPGKAKEAQETDNV